MNEYYLKARLIPTVLTMVPLVVLYIYIVSPLVSEILSPIWRLLPVFTGVSLNVAVMFLLVLLNRFVSKIIFQKIFYQDDLFMPTTNFLMPNDSSLDKVSRNRYYNLILTDFDIDMKKSLKALKNDTQKRQMIARIVGQIRYKLYGNKMLLQHNIEYGFWRNFTGGSVIAVIIAIALYSISYVSNNRSMQVTSIVLIIIYSLPILFSKILIKYHGNNYAKVLFEQYGSIER